MAPHLRRAGFQSAEDRSTETNVRDLRVGLDLVAAERTESRRRRSSTTACCSFTLSATRCKRSTRPPAICSGSTSRRLPVGVAPSVKRGICDLRHSLYVPTSDAHVVALDVKTGKVVWDQAIADAQGGLSGSPAARWSPGQGDGRHDRPRPGGNFIVALDAETGKEAWRFNTIARPGEPGGRHLERTAAREAQRRVGVDSRQLRSGSQPRLLRPRRIPTTPVRCATRSIEPGMTNDAPLSRFDAGDQSRYRAAAVVLPAPGQRPVGSRLGVRAPDHAVDGQRRHGDGRR